MTGKNDSGSLLKQVQLFNVAVFALLLTGFVVYREVAGQVSSRWEFLAWSVGIFVFSCVMGLLVELFGLWIKRRCGEEQQ